MRSSPRSQASQSDVSSELTDGAFDRTADHLLDGVGYEVGVQKTHSTAEEGVHWLTNGTFKDPKDPLPAFVVFDLGANYDLDAFTVWNYNEAGVVQLKRGANAVTVSVANSVGGSFTVLSSITTFAKAPGNTITAFGETFDLTSESAADDVRLVRIDITSNYGTGDDFVGLSEIRFGGTPGAGPTPGTLIYGK